MDESNGARRSQPDEPNGDSGAKERRMVGKGPPGAPASQRDCRHLPARNNDATEVQGCKAPIRLTLRGIRPGESPKDVAMRQPEDAASLSAAAVINTKREMSDEARARLEAATRSMAARDGNNCLAELDAHDELDPKHESTDPGSGFGMMRAQCLMLAGKCDAGKALMTKSFAQTAGMASLAPEQIDRTVEAMASLEPCNSTVHGVSGRTQHVHHLGHTGHGPDPTDNGLIVPH